MKSLHSALQFHWKHSIAPRSTATVLRKVKPSILAVNHKKRVYILRYNSYDDAFPDTVTIDFKHDYTTRKFGPAIRILGHPNLVFSHFTSQPQPKFSPDGREFFDTYASAHHADQSQKIRTYILYLDPYTESVLRKTKRVNIIVPSPCHDGRDIIRAAINFLRHYPLRDYTPLTDALLRFNTRAKAAYLPSASFIAPHELQAATSQLNQLLTTKSYLDIAKAELLTADALQRLNLIQFLLHFNYRIASYNEVATAAINAIAASQQSQA